MKNSLWKLAVLAGVAGIGFLVVVQAQQGLSLLGVRQAAKAPPAPGSAEEALDRGAQPPDGELGRPGATPQLASQSRGARPSVSSEGTDAPPAWPPAEPDDSVPLRPEPAQPEPVAEGDSPARLPGPPTDGLDFRGGPTPVAHSAEPVAATADPFDPGAPAAMPTASADAGSAALEPVPAEPQLLTFPEPATVEPASRAGSPTAVADAPPADDDSELTLNREPSPPATPAELPTGGPELGEPAQLNLAQASNARPLPAAPERALPKPAATASTAPPSRSTPAAGAPETVEVTIKARQTPSRSATAAPPRAAVPSFDPGPQSGAIRRASTDSRSGTTDSVPRAGLEEPSPPTPDAPLPEPPSGNDPFGPFTEQPPLASPDVQEPGAAFPPAGELQERSPQAPESPPEMPAFDEAAGAPASARSEPRPVDSRFAPEPRAAAPSHPLMERTDEPPPAGADLARDSAERVPAADPRARGAELSRAGEPPSNPFPERQPRPEFGPDVEPTPPGDPLAAMPRDDRRAPDPLAPPTAPPLTPTADELRGDGTLDADAPRGAQRPQLKIEKVAPPNAVLGQPLVYNIVVRNVGSSTAYEVVVEDRIPKGTQLEGTIPRAEMLDKKLIWKLGELEPGKERKIAVRVVPQTEGQIGSVTTVNFVAEVAAETVVTAPKLKLTLEGPPQATVGSAVTYRFTLTNTGSGDAGNVWIRNLIPAELRHPDGDDLEYEVGTLPAGASREVTLSVTAVKPGQVTNRATASADGGVTVEAESPLEIVGDQISIARTGPKQRFLGRPATYVNRVSNDADRPAVGIVVTELVPEGMEFVEATAGGQYDPARRTVMWRIDRILPGQTQDVQVTLQPQAVGTYQSQVAVRGANGGQAEVQSETTVEGFAALGLEMAPVEGPIGAGEQVALRIAARNRGNQPATNVQVTIALPAELELVAARGPSRYAQDGQKLVFEVVPSVAGNGQAQFEILLKARRDGNARVQVEIASDQLQRPLTREEIVYVLPAAQ